MLNLAVLLEDSAREAPANTAVIFNELKLSYAAVNAAANQVAGGLASIGIQPGDKFRATLDIFAYQRSCSHE